MFSHEDNSGLIKEITKTLEENSSTILDCSDKKGFEISNQKEIN